MDVQIQTEKNDKGTYMLDTIAHCTEVELMCIVNKQPVDISVSFGNDEDDNEEK